MTTEELDDLRLVHANQVLDGHYKHNGIGIRLAHKDGYEAGFLKALELISQVDVRDRDDGNLYALDVREKMLTPFIDLLGIDLWP